MKLKLLILSSLLVCNFHFLNAQKTLVSPHPSIPLNIIPQGLGINIHFTDPKPDEMEMLSEAGFHRVRMDLFWSRTEKRKGVYDFSAYDRLVSTLNEYDIRAIFILDYANPLYDNGKAPESPEAVKAFAEWAATAVKRFSGNNILWEMWNEPNIGSWTTKLDIDSYIQLALATGEAIKKVAPNETIIGPAASRIPLDYLESCFKAGLLNYWDAVSLHPYRLEEDPETVIEDYETVRQLIEKYAPPQKSIPIISGEWGYSSATSSVDAEKQGKLLAREFLTNLSCGIPLSIWYDWHNDGNDLKEFEHNFGTVGYAYHSGRNPVYDPKPAYLAAKTLMHVLNGFHFEERVIMDKDDYILLFKKGEEYRYVAWTTNKPHTISLSTKREKYQLLDYKGNDLKMIERVGTKLELTLTDAPQYLIRSK